MLPAPLSPPATRTLPSPASPELPVSQPVIVLNATIDVCVTGSGRVCALTSRWHPLARNEVITTGLFVASEEQHQSAAEPVIGYLVAGDGDPQRFPAPYFLSSGHAGLVAAPASSNSLTALIASGGEGEFHVVVGGSSAGGQLRYAWAAYSVTDPDSGTFGLGTEDRVRLEPGSLKGVLQGIF
jgi:hypothetical protein